MRIKTPLAFFLVASTLNAQKITTFDVPGAIYTEPIAISTSGDIVGRFIATQNPYIVRGFLRKANGTFTLFDAVPNPSTFTSTAPIAVSPSGEIVGYFQVPPAGDFVGFVRDSHGTITTFNLPGAQTIPTGLNPRGEAVGFLFESEGEVGFKREPDGTVTQISFGPGVYGQFPDTQFTGINAAGQICGFYATTNNDTFEEHGLLRDRDGNITSFDILNATFTDPVAINDKGQIAGNWENRTPEEVFASGAFLRDTDGTITKFDVGSNGMTAVAISTKGDITGYYEVPDITGLHPEGFLRQADGTLTTFGVPNAAATEPTAMNAQGVITGLYLDMSGTQHGFVMTP